MKSYVNENFRFSNANRNIKKFYNLLENVIIHITIPVDATGANNNDVVYYNYLNINTINYLNKNKYNIIDYNQSTFDDSAAILKLSNLINYQNCLLSESVFSYVNDCNDDLFFLISVQDLIEITQEVLHYNNLFMKNNLLKSEMVIIQNTESLPGRIASNLAHQSNITIKRSAPNSINKVKKTIIDGVHRKRTYQNVNIGNAQLFSISEVKGNNKLLFDLRYYSHFISILPIINLLIENKVYDIYIISDYNTVIQRFPRCKLVIPPNNNYEVCYNINKTKIRENILNLLNYIDMEKNIKEIITGESLNQILRNLPFIQKGQNQFIKILDYLKPDLFIVGMDRTPIIRSEVFLAKQAKIQTIEIQHGIYKDVLQALPISDYFCLWGEYAKEIMIHSGTPESSIVITGAPIFDDPGYDVNSSSFKSNKFNLLIVTQPLYYIYFRNIIADIIDTFTDKNIEIKVKPHPTEFINNYEIGNTSNDFPYTIAGQKDDTNELINWADGVLVVNSTATFNAIIKHKFVFQLNVLIDNNPFTKIAIPVSNAKEILDAIETTANKLFRDIYEKKITDFIKYHLGEIDNLSSTRCKKVIDYCLMNHK